MENVKEKRPIWKKIPAQVVCVIALIIAAAGLIWFNVSNSTEAMSAIAAKVDFRGEYRVGDGSWHEIVEGEHIPATKGDVTLRGNFHISTPDDEYIGIYDDEIPIALYMDHIGATVQLSNGESYLLDSENPLYGVSSCCSDWLAHSFSGLGKEPIELIIHNPHRYGNETAIDEMLDSVALWGDINFERDIMESGEDQRNIGLIFIIVSLVLLGTALFSALLHIQNNQIMWEMGAAILFAGLYFFYSSSGISFWFEFSTVNTTILGMSMMFYMLFVSGLSTSFLTSTRKIGYIATITLVVLVGSCFLMPVVTSLQFYDTWVLWVIGQSVANLVLFGCFVKEYFGAKRGQRWAFVGMSLLLLAFEIDAIATALGAWRGGFISRYVFIVLFIVVLVVVLRIIPRSINNAEKARELELERSRLEAEKNMIEAELKDSRISIMLSQIQPHFIYNTLGTIERMCLKDPQKAFELVRNFSLYLRGNFSELDSVAPIRFVEELKHVEYYVNIEKVRFPDMQIEYDVQAVDFVLPALSVQPLVENAIKHGLMRLESGGNVLIHSFETATHFCVEVKDDGVGFDPKKPIEEKKHVGLRNIQGRLKAMVNGELLIESEPNVGTRVVIMIPKE